MKDTRVSLSTLFIVSAIVGAGAFAAGRSTGGSSASSSPGAITSDPRADDIPPVSLPRDPNAGGPSTGDLPKGHPAIDPNAPPATDMGGGAGKEPASLEWKVPSKWKVVPNPSTMRIATYKVPRSDGDSADAEVSVTQAGGSVQANVDRWIGQFDAAAQKGAKQTKKKIAGLEVTIVEVEGTFSGGMTPGGGEQSGTALLGAIVATPGMPHFFKMTGPAKTVHDARPDLDALLASMKPASGAAASASAPTTAPAASGSAARRSSP